MGHSQPQTRGIVIHSDRAYDVTFGRLIRTTDAEILARAGVASGDRVLDVGTGPGYLALAASKLVGLDGGAVGIDASAEMIARARILAARRGSHADYVVASAEALPFGEASFDVAVSRLVFHHLPGDVKTKALAEIARVLKPGGRLVLVDLASATAQGAHHLLARVLGRRPHTGAALEELIAGAGFTQLTRGRLAHGLLAGVAARAPERSADG